MVAQHYSLGIGGQFGDHGQVIHVGRGQAEAGDQSRPVQTQVYPEAVKSLPGHVGSSERGFSPKPLTAVGPSSPSVLY